MKLLLPASLLMCVLVIIAGAVSCAPQASAEGVDTILPGSLAQDTAPDSKAAPNLSGNWQMSWTDKDGNSKEAKLKIRQDGSSISGTFQGERGSAPLIGSLEGNQVSLEIKAPKRQISFTGTVDGDKITGKEQQGRSWTATRQ